MNTHFYYEQAKGTRMNAENAERFLISALVCARPRPIFKLSGS